jgi:16S rRNA G966 N2-methylase RsmD
MAADPNLTTSPAALHPEPHFNFRRAFARHWRESVRRHGVWRTVRQQGGALFRLLRELLPDRRKSKYGDLEYDWDHMVDTTRANVPFRTQLMAALSGHQYFPSEPWLFDEIMHALCIDFSRFTFVDLGSGKGRTLLMAASRGFRRAIGVEYIPELHRVAVENVRRFVAAHAVHRTQLESVCMDARDFDFPPDPLVVYIYNPFPEAVLAGVLERLAASMAEKPRPTFIAYRYLEFEKLLMDCDWLEKIAGTEQWAVYKASGDHRHRVIG